MQDINEFNEYNKYVQIQSITVYLTEDKDPVGDTDNLDIKARLAFDITKAKYRYSTTKSLDQFTGLYTMSQQNEKWFVVMEFKRNSLGRLDVIPIGLLVASAVLLGVWLVLNAYYKNYRFLS